MTDLDKVQFYAKISYVASGFAVFFALLSLIMLFIGCQPPMTSTSGDATSAANSTGASAALSQWMPRVLAIEGTCDASLYLQVGPVLTRVKVDAAAGHDSQVGADLGASVALESALASFSCTYLRGHVGACEQGPGVLVVAPEAPAVEAPTSEAPSVEAPASEAVDAPLEDSSSAQPVEDASSQQDTSEGEVQ